MIMFPFSDQVVVGIDDSPTNGVVLDHAAAIADRRRLPLRIIHAYQWPPVSYPVMGIASPIDDPRQRASWILEQAVDRVRDRYPDLTVSGKLTERPAAQMLIDSSRHAVVTVVGGHGRGVLSGLVTGSVGLSLITHAHGPVMIVRSDGYRPEQLDSKPVVVGVGDEVHDAAAVRFAADEAALRGVELILVHSAKLPQPVPAVPTSGPASRSAALVKERWPELEVRPQEVSDDNPRHALAVAAQGAGLLVMGARGHGRMRGLWSGAVGQTLSREIDCPIVVVREETSR